MIATTESSQSGIAHITFNNVSFIALDSQFLRFPSKTPSPLLLPSTSTPHSPPTLIHATAGHPHSTPPSPSITLIPSKFLSPIPPTSPSLHYSVTPPLDPSIPPPLDPSIPTPASILLLSLIFWSKCVASVFPSVPLFCPSICPSGYLSAYQP